MIYPDKTYLGTHAEEPCAGYKAWTAKHGEDGFHLCWVCAWPKSSHEIPNNHDDVQEASTAT